MKLDSAVFYTNDIDKALAFYKDTIGLEIEYFQEGQFVSFMFENNVRLGIKRAIEEREKPGGQTIFIETKEIEKLNIKYKDMRLSFYKELKQEDWGKQFSILDPDKNKVLFIEKPQ